MVSLAAIGVSEDDLRGIPPALLSRRKDSRPVIVLGVILILVGYLLPVPAIIATIGWILLVIGVVLLILGQVGRPVGGRRYWY
jgi:protein-S-isoprenylcysteine O-methyltransferase Ste14